MGDRPTPPPQDMHGAHVERKYDNATNRRRLNLLCEQTDWRPVKVEHRNGWVYTTLRRPMSPVERAQSG